MELHKKMVKKTRSEAATISISSSGFPKWYVFAKMEEHQGTPYPDCGSALMGMLLEDEIGRQKKNPSWSLVESVIRELDPGHFNSFACLSVHENTYVQCLCGFNGWHLEWRITKPSGDYDHYRACYPGGSKKPFELKKSDRMSGGEHRDLLKLEDVIGAFHSFHQGRGLPSFVEWRELDI